MIENYTLYLLIAFFASALCGLAFIPLTLNFCKQKGLYDLPNSRKIHKSAVPRLGGISFMPSMLLATIVAIVVYNHEGNDQQVTFSLWSVAFFFSLLLIYGVGIVDDVVGLGARTKFSIQVIA